MQKVTQGRCLVCSAPAVPAPCTWLLLASVLRAPVGLRLLQSACVSFATLLVLLLALWSLRKAISGLFI